MHRTIIAGALAGMLGGAAAPAAPLPSVDAAIVTAVDLSGSISRHEEWLQVEGIARALSHADFLEAVRHGRRGRVAFAVYAWSSGARVRLLVPWTMIEDGDSARRTATALRRAPRPTRFGGGDDDDASASPPPGLTDLSAAIDVAVELFAAAPVAPDRMVLNVLADGVDNVAGGPTAARDDALAAGIVINGVAVGAAPALEAYFRDHVIGGFGSFVLGIGDPGSFAAVMRRKFLMDLIAGPTGAPGTGGWRALSDEAEPPAGIAPS